MQEMQFTTETAKVIIHICHAAGNCKLVYLYHMFIHKNKNYCIQCILLEIMHQFAALQKDRKVYIIFIIMYQIFM